MGEKIYCKNHWLKYIEKRKKKLAMLLYGERGCQAKFSFVCHLLSIHQRRGNRLVAKKELKFEILA